MLRAEIHMIAAYHLVLSSTRLTWWTILAAGL